MGVSKFLVIDGQQRLTTLTLLLCAVRDALPADIKERKRIQKHFLTNEDYEGWDELKLLPTQPDRAAFRSIVLGEPRETWPSSRMVEAYDFFSSCIAGKDGDGQPIDPLRLLATIETRLMVVSINLGDADDPYLIFESLNFKGSPLTQADLVRNYFLMRFPVQEQQEVYEQSWLPMQTRLGEHLTEFMRVYLMRSGDEILKGEIYRVIKRRIEPPVTPAQVKSELAAMHELSKSYRTMVKPADEPDPEVRRRLETVSSLEVTTSHPLLLTLYDRYRRGEISANEMAAVLRVIESYAMRRFFCEVPTNTLKKIYLGLAKSYANEAPAAWLSEQLAQGTFGRRWPKDDEFREAWRRLPLYLRRDRCRLVLERLELDHGHKEPADLSKATIEHVMPQTLTPWWHDHLGADASQHEALMHTVGNLTLSAYNADMSNSPFPEKQAEFAKSHCSLNAYFASQGEWHRVEIEARADALFERARTLWPRPS